MSQAELAASGPLGTTETLARWISATTDADITASARTWARHALLDWTGVAIAGTGERLAAILREETAGCPGPSTLLAGAGRARPGDAALYNGAAGHALDYDDVNGAMGGHPTAVVAPAALAVAEAVGADGPALERAIVVGHEAAGALGAMAGREHYDNGFHTTGTIGTFGAAAAAASLLALDAERTQTALGLAATQASGLKAMFGTMAKPLHAGKAAMNGVLAARLAGAGFTARGGAVEGPQGFMATQAPGFAPAPVRPDPHAPFHVEATLFKYHASCYLTHSAIEAVRELRARERLTLDDLATMTVYAAASHQKVCDIREPQTGLDIKFSVRHLLALALDGRDTSDLALFTDATAHEPLLVAAREKITFEPRTLASRHAAAVALETTDGRSLLQEADVGVPATDLPAQWERLARKTLAIVTPVLGARRAHALVAAVDGLDRAPDLGAYLEAAA